jgi:hypothetical protein
MENMEEELIQEDGSNRTFAILVSVLGGLLVLGIAAFAAWAFFVAPNMRADIESQNEAVFATNTAVAIAAAATKTAAVTPTPTDTATPTDTPPPPDTPTPRPTTASPTPEATATLTFGTPQAGEESESTDKGLPQTGVGVLGAAALAGGLAFLLILVRRLRKTA